MDLRLGFLLNGGESSKLVPLKLLFLIHFAAFSMLPYLPIYFDSKHYTKVQIGVLLAIPCVCAILGPPIWGVAADILQHQRRVHVVCLVSAALLTFSLQFVAAFPTMCIMVFLANFQSQPTFSLLDQSAMALTAQFGGDYGKQRLFGAIGWGAGGYLAGVVAAAAGIARCFNMVLALSCISLVILVWFIPAVDVRSTKLASDVPDRRELTSTVVTTVLEIEPVHDCSNFVTSLALIATKRDLVALFGVVLLAGIMSGVIDNFLFLYLFNLSSNDTHLVGVILAIETMSELPLFFFADRILARFETPQCVLACLVAYAVRLTVYAYVQHPWTALPIEMTHGITLSLLWAACTNYVFHAAPLGTEGTMLGVLAAVQKGLGSGIGALAGGYIYEHYSARTMWRVAGFGVAPLAIVVAGVFASVCAHPQLAMDKRPVLKRNHSAGTCSDPCGLLISEQTTPASAIGVSDSATSNRYGATDSTSPNKSSNRELDV